MKIGILDSGVGGLSVLFPLLEKNLQVDFIYLGDTVNCPYGNKSSEEIIKLTQSLVGILLKEKVDMILLSCNTMSCFIKDLKTYNSVPIFSIISAGVEAIIKSPYLQEEKSKIGLLGTNATIASKIYPTFLQEKGYKGIVIEQPCITLAKCIEENRKDLKEIVKQEMDSLLKKQEVDVVILGCTHYTLAEKIFSCEYPYIDFFHPSYAQVDRVVKFLKDKGIEEGKGTLEVYSTGDLTKLQRVWDDYSKGEKVEIKRIGGEICVS